MEKSTSLTIAALIALIATLCSLIGMEILDLPPCGFCWYQRVAMFPLALWLSMAAIRKDFFIIPYGLTLTCVGFAIAAYHLLYQGIPLLSADLKCSKCAAAMALSTHTPAQETALRFSPFLSTVAFLLIGIFLLLAYTKPLPKTR